MKNKILIYGEPEPYFCQLLRKFGALHLATAEEDWHDFDWVGVAGNALTTDAFRLLALEVLHSGRTFGAIEASAAQMDVVAGIIGVYPATASVGVVVSPWYDASGVQQFKQVYFRAISERQEAELRQQGKSPDALKYLLLSNALRMHVETMADEYGTSQTNGFHPGEAIVPVQKRPVNFFPANVHQLEKCQFFHHGSLFVVPPDADGTSTVHFLHQISRFSHPLSRQLEHNQLVNEPEPAFHRHTTTQQLEFKLHITPWMRRPFGSAECRPLDAELISADPACNWSARTVSKPSGFEIVIRPNAGADTPPGQLSFRTSFTWKQGTALSPLLFQITAFLGVNQEQQRLSTTAMGTNLQQEPATHFQGKFTLYSEWVHPDITMLKQEMQPT